MNIGWWVIEDNFKIDVCWTYSVTDNNFILDVCRLWVDVEHVQLSFISPAPSDSGRDSSNKQMEDPLLSFGATKVNENWDNCSCCKINQYDVSWKNIISIYLDWKC